MDDVQRLLCSMYREYTNGKGMNLDRSAAYFNGTPLRPVVPLDCGIGSVFILGAYPSSRFMVAESGPDPEMGVKKVTDVPGGDNLGPFEDERWFDGTRVREQPSARELNEHFLVPLRLDRRKCWVTDLVKVFLFKKGHVDRYKKINAIPPAGYERERFHELGELSLPWIAKELAVAQPKLMITLGAEVAGILHGIKVPAQQVALLEPKVSRVSLGGPTVDTIHCAHPGILMRKRIGEGWLKRHEDEFIGEISAHLESKGVERIPEARR